MVAVACRIALLTSDHFYQIALVNRSSRVRWRVAKVSARRVGVERTLGYKQPKYVNTIGLVEDFSTMGQRKGGYWEDNGYDWYGGI